MFNKIIVFTLTLVLFTAVVAQDPPIAAPMSSKKNTKTSSWGSIKKIPTVNSFISLESRFKIGLSQQIQGFGGLSPKQLGFNASGSEFTWKYDEGEIAIISLEFPESDLKGTKEELQRIIANTHKNILTKTPTARMRDDAFFNLSIFPASKSSFDLPDDKVLVQRVYLFNNRMFRLIAVFQDKENESFVNSAFDSFSFISQSEIDAEIEKKYKSIKPVPLPQSPVVPKLKSDAEDEGLKGKVKKVIRESEDLSGTWSVQGRKMAWVTYFNEQGNFVQQDFYDYKGLPSSISVYGFIDGKRVSSDKYTSYDESPPIMAPAPLSSKKEEPLKPDTRYQMSYEFKYLDGKLAEKIWISNTRKLWLRYVYKYSKDQLEELVYSEDGKLNQHYLKKLDDKGNEIEQTNLDVLKIYGDRKYRYEYEFDKQGNWIKQTTYKEETENGVKVFKPYSVYYRTIIYW